MPAELDTTHDNTENLTSTDSTEEIVMNDVEADAGFLEDRDPEDYPSRLRITSESDEAHRRGSLERIDR